MVTVESIPVEKNKGDKLIGATVNGTGTMIMDAKRVGSETLLAQIVRLVSEAQRSRAPIQKVADVVAGYLCRPYGCAEQTPTLHKKDSKRIGKRWELRSCTRFENHTRNERTVNLRIGPIIGYLFSPAGKPEGSRSGVAKDLQ
jgi:hypothetical protein